MDFNDDEPKTVPAMTVGQVLDDFSVDELAERLKVLKAEILRVEAEIVNKKSTKSQAESVFKI